jgi:hypothetical protein
LGDGIAGEFVTEVGELELEALGDCVGVGESFGEVAEEGGHFCGAAEVAVVVGSEQASGVVEVDVVADGGEDVEDFAVVWAGVADAVGGDDGEAERAGQAERGLVAGFFVGELVALELDADILAAVEGDEVFEEDAAGGLATGGEGSGEWAFVAAGEAEEAFGVLGEVVVGGGSFGLGGFAHFELGDELAEVLIAGARGAEERETCWFGWKLMREKGGRRKALAKGGGRDFGADGSADAVAFGAGVHAGGAVDAVAVEQGDGGELDFEGALDEVFGLGGGFEEGEGAGGVELDIIRD